MTFGDRAAELAGHAGALLGWRPAEFWAATPSELATAFGLQQQDAQTVDRATIERLLSRFPDNREN